MRHFHDNRTRKWTIDLTEPVVARIRELAGVDLDVCVQPAAGCKLLGELFDSDHGKLVDVIFVSVMTDAERRHITDLDFAAGMVGAIKPASRALLFAVGDRHPQMRPLIDKALWRATKSRFKGAWQQLLAKLRRKGA